MRRMLIILTAVGLIVGGTAVKIRAQSPAAGLTVQQAAQQLLKTRAAKIMTGPSLASMRMLANSNRIFGQDTTMTDQRPVVAFNGTRGGGGPPSGTGMSNVRVNNPGEDSHQDSQTTQSETTIAVSGKNVVVGFNDSQTTLLVFTPGTNLSGYAYSRNGGQTWTDGGTIPNGLGGANNFGDPWLASDSAGNMYYSNLAGIPGVGLAVAVAKSTNGGQTFTPATLLPNPPLGSNSFSLGADKDSLFSSGAGLFDTWDNFTVTADPNTGNFSEKSGLVLDRSTDGAQTWSTQYVDQVTAFDPANPCSFHQYIGGQSITGSAGAVYVAALRFDVNDNGDNFPCPNGVLTESEYIFASHDGGATFGPGVKIADVTPSTQIGAFALGAGELMRNLEFPTLAFRGTTLYATWNDGGLGHSHIRLARSTDGGNTWTTSWVTSGSNDEAQPAITSDATGLHILYYQISSAANGTSVLDATVSNSTDGSSFTARRVTNRSFPGVLTNPQFDPIIAPAYMGDYIANVSDGTNQYYAWGDNRDTVTDFLYPQGRSDPNVYFAGTGISGGGDNNDNGHSG